MWQFIDLFSKQRSNKESFNNIVHHRAITISQYCFISKKFNVKLIRLITNLGGGDY